MNMEYAALKARQREIRDNFPGSLGLRTHRALSWLNKAEQDWEDPDARFVFLWIAFNAAYGQDLSYVEEGVPEWQKFSDFFSQLVEVDTDRVLYEIIWKETYQTIRQLLDNRYVFQPFWKYKKGLISEEKWEGCFRASKENATKALYKGDVGKILLIVFERLYVLRNQVMHGNSTWKSGKNRTQVEDGADVMGALIPVIIHLMMEHYDRGWGEPSYPVVE